RGAVAEVFRTVTKVPVRSADIHSAMLSFKKYAARRRVERLLRDGVGVHERAWDLPSHSEDEPRGLVAPIVDWVRLEMGLMRRPNGIDHVALALACRDEDGRVVVSNSFGVVRPGMFYQDEGADRIAAFMDDVEHASTGQRREIVAALLSL